MRESREVRFRYVGDEAAAMTYIPRARTLLGQLRTQQLDLGLAQQAVRTTPLPDGTIIRCEWNSWMPTVTIDVRGREVEEKEEKEWIYTRRGDPLSGKWEILRFLAGEDVTEVGELVVAFSDPTPEAAETVKDRFAVYGRRIVSRHRSGLGTSLRVDGSTVRSYTASSGSGVYGEYIVGVTVSAEHIFALVACSSGNISTMNMYIDKLTWGGALLQREDITLSGVLYSGTRNPCVRYESGRLYLSREYAPGVPYLWIYNADTLQLLALVDKQPDMSASWPNIDAFGGRLVRHERTSKVQLWDLAQGGAGETIDVEAYTEPGWVGTQHIALTTEFLYVKIYLGGEDSHIVMLNNTSPYEVLQVSPLSNFNDVHEMHCDPVTEYP
jgi:hypothetical protein